MMNAPISAARTKVSRTGAKRPAAKFCATKYIDEEIQSLKQHPGGDWSRHLQNVPANRMFRQVLHGIALIAHPRDPPGRALECDAGRQVLRCRRANEELSKVAVLPTVETNAGIRLERFAGMAELAPALAADVAQTLARAIAARGAASLVVSGGRTPVKFFEQLRAQPLEWRRVSIALADERWVEPSDSASNERMVREVLLAGRAADARFAGLKNAAPSPDLGAVSAWETFARVPRPFDVLLLGMGDDGHTASLFPGSPNLRIALNPAAAAGCVGMWAPAAPQARLSLNLSALLDSRRVLILIEGEAKMRTYQSASGPGAIEEMPVRAVLRQSRAPVEVIWAP